MCCDGTHGSPVRTLTLQEEPRAKSLKHRRKQTGKSPVVRIKWTGNFTAGILCAEKGRCRSPDPSTSRNSVTARMSVVYINMPLITAPCDGKYARIMSTNKADSQLKKGKRF
jgi:hypothetical protein